jgi:2-polyprenyl-3-methyl-5-hydroxy-6-metoxy-1,4-benzoquinol methylase
MEALTRFNRTLKVIQPYFNTNKAWNILDLGCGSGWFAFSIKQRYPQHRITVADIEIPEELRRKFREADILPLTDVEIEPNKRLNLKDKSFDVVVCLEVLEHIIDKPEHVFGELKRILKDDGYLFLSTPNIAQLFNRFMLLFGKQPQLYLSSLHKGYCGRRGHFREWTMDELTHILPEYFNIERCLYIDSIGTEGMISQKKAYRLLYYPYKALSRFKPSFRTTLLIIARA